MYVLTYLLTYLLILTCVLSTYLHTTNLEFRQNLCLKVCTHLLGGCSSEFGTHNFKYMVALINHEDKWLLIYFHIHLSNIESNWRIVGPKYHLSSLASPLPGHEKFPDSLFF